MADFDIKGLDAFLRKMKTVKREIVGKAVRSAANKGMRPVRDAARAKAQAIDDPDSKANIPKNIAISTRNQPRLGQAIAKVGVRGGARWSKSDPPEATTHWRYVELGTEDTPAQPFMRPALEENVQKVVDGVVAELDPALDKAIAKAR